MAKEIGLQQGLKADGDQLESARGYDKKLQDLGHSLVASLYMLIRNVKLYDPENAIFHRPLDQCKQTINTIVAMDGKLDLQAAGSSFYLNNMLLRMDSKSLENVRFLHKELEEKDVGGFLLDQSVSLSELRNFIFIFSKENDEQAGEQGVSAKKLVSLKLRRFKKIQEILENQETQDVDKRLDRKRYALLAYARTVLFMHKFMQGQRGQGPAIPIARAGRLIQDLVDVVHGHRANFLGVMSINHQSGDRSFHAVNVTLLSIVFAQEAGLPKERLRELGMVTLFHDIGCADVPEDIMAKREGLSEEEQQRMAMLRLYSIQRLLRMRDLSRRMLHVVVAAFDHKTEYGRAYKDLKGNVGMVEKLSELTVYSRILAITDCYDELVSLGYSPEIALTLMNSELKHRFDPNMLKRFLFMMKGLASRLLNEHGEKVSVF
ncbi:MAG: hypothetical protein JRF33_20065 [Deltaproteobacteria bacterium]|nr:hypothetical protein [Deltaproteobacteria bacterium]